jgi:hypothetical protein
MGSMSNLRSKVGGAAVVDLRRRVRRLEDEVQECRRLNLRLAELTDIMSELLLPLEQRDEERLTALLATYQNSL